MKNNLLKVLIFLVFLLSLTPSCKEIRDLLKAIDKYGYKSKTPLGKKDIPIDKLILGSYVYNNLPIIISEKDSYTYKLKFLATELDESDIEIEAFLSEIGTSKYLNLDLGYSFCFLKIDDVSILRDVDVKLIKNTLEGYVNEKNLRSWLLKHDNEDEFVTDDSTELDIFYVFNFLKITEERAYQIKNEQLKEKKENLFSKCTGYENYKELSAKYMGDPSLSKAREAILDKCTTIEDYEDFVSYFASDILCDKAKKIIVEKKLFLKDSADFNVVITKDDIHSYLNYIDGCATKIYRDSAVKMLPPIAEKITEENIEWKWNGGDKKEAIMLITYKIDYAPKNINTSWYREHLTNYGLNIEQAVMKEKALAYLDKLAMGNATRDEMLDLYLSKGFLLWSLEKYDQALEVFKSKIHETYQNKEDLTFKKNVKLNFNAFKKQGVVLPDENNMWKRVKKLK